jgi:serine/threonine protein kinase
VWRAVHSEARVDVAVKLLAGTPIARELAAFRREVRAVAALRHASIVLVLDHGVVDAAAAQASDGKLLPGNPWLAMELAAGGSLDRFPRLLGARSAPCCSRCSRRWRTRTRAA